MTWMTTNDKFLDAYIECALWSSTKGDDVGTPLDDTYGVHDLAEETLADMREDCKQFQADNESLLSDLDDSQAGHDFWLTRNHHGAGFWDRGLGEAGTKLTDAAHAWGSSDLYVGDDNKLYLQ